MFEAMFQNSPKAMRDSKSQIQKEHQTKQIPPPKLQLDISYSNFRKIQTKSNFKINQEAGEGIS